VLLPEQDRGVCLGRRDARYVEHPKGGRDQLASVAKATDSSINL
jgi:hypothetical protein